MASFSGVGHRKKKKGKAKVGKVRHHKSVTAREIHEVKRVGAISYTGGKVRISGTGEIEQAKRALLHKLGQQAGWLEVAISQEKTAAGKKRLHRKLSEIRAEMRRIS